MGIKVLFIMLMATLFGCSLPPNSADIRASVVKLASNKGSCSGTQIITNKGNKYILTAAHCAVLALDGLIHVITEDSGSYFSRIIEEDGQSDLLLLEAAPSVPAISIANDLSRQERLKSYTHGNGYPTYSTEGVYIGEDVAQFMTGVIHNEAERAACNKPKNKVERIQIFGIDIGEICTVKVSETVTTTKMVPGSSGGLIANSRGRLVGVCSAGNEAFTYLVTLKDIHRFLNDR